MNGSMVRCLHSLWPAAVIFLAAFPAVSPVHAQSAYPDKPLRLVVGFSAGGATDLPARFIAERLSSALAQRVVVENRPGAAGQIATQDVISKPRDGYNLLLCTHFESVNVAIRKAAAYKLEDIAPVTQISRYYYGIAIANSVPAADWRALIAYGRANPGKLNSGSVGRGSAQEIISLEIGKLTGTTLTIVPYKGGGDMIKDVLAGRVHVYVAPTLPVLPHYKAGKLKIVGVTSPERLAVFPDAPTLSELGLPLVRFGWIGVCAGSGTPPSIIAQLNRQIAAIVNSPDYREMTEKAGSVPISSTPEGLGKVMAETYEQTIAVVREFNLQVE